MSCKKISLLYISKNKSPFDIGSHILISILFNEKGNFLRFSKYIDNNNSASLTVKFFGNSIKVSLA